MILYDAVTPSNIPVDAEAVAGYMNGLYAWKAEDWARFPDAIKVTISINSTGDADVLDVEWGDATPAEAPPWTLRQRALGKDPAVYCQESTLQNVKDQFDQAGVAYPHFWEAWYDGVAEVPAGVDAKQYAGNVPPGIDVSICGPNWPSRPQPGPTVIPIIGAEPPMGLNIVNVNLDSNGNGSIILDGGANSAAGVTSISPAIPWDHYQGIAMHGTDPAADGGYPQGTCFVQERAGFLLVDVVGGKPGGQAAVVITAAI